MIAISGLMRDEVELKAQWRSLYQEILPVIAKARGWPVHLDHCIARIIYDRVAGDKWDRVWQKPAIHNLDNLHLQKCIDTAQALIDEKLDPVALNIQSLEYRGRI